MLLIGIIIGSIAGYFGNYMITKPILNDLQDRLYTLEENHDTLESNYNNLTE